MLKNLNPTQKFILILLLILAVLIITFSVYKYFKTKRIENLVSNNTGTVNTNQITVNVGLKASEINDALHGSMWTEDEQKAINAVLSTPKPLIPQLSSTYFALTGYNLSEDLQTYLSASEWLMIKQQFE